MTHFELCSFPSRDPTLREITFDSFFFFHRLSGSGISGPSHESPRLPFMMNTPLVVVSYFTVIRDLSSFNSFLSLSSVRDFSAFLSCIPKNAPSRFVKAPF